MFVGSAKLLCWAFDGGGGDKQLHVPCEEPATLGRPAAMWTKHLARTSQVSRSTAPTDADHSSESSILLLFLSEDGGCLICSACLGGGRESKRSTPGFPWNPTNATNSHPIVYISPNPTCGYWHVFRISKIGDSINRSFLYFLFFVTPFLYLTLTNVIRSLKYHKEQCIEKQILFYVPRDV